MLLCDNYLNCVISSGFKALADLVFQFRLQLVVDNSKSVLRSQNQSVIPQEGGQGVVLANNTLLAGCCWPEQ